MLQTTPFIPIIFLIYALAMISALLTNIGYALFSFKFYPRPEPSFDSYTSNSEVKAMLLKIQISVGATSSPKAGNIPLIRTNIAHDKFRFYLNRWAQLVLIYAVIANVSCVLIYFTTADSIWKSVFNYDFKQYLVFTILNYVLIYLMGAVPFIARYSFSCFTVKPFQVGVTLSPNNAPIILVAHADIGNDIGNDIDANVETNLK